MAGIIGGVAGLFIAVSACIGIGLLLIRDENRLRRLAAGRRGEGICTFAREFQRGTVHPHILRSVYDELSILLRYSRGVVPLRGTDRLHEELRMDAEAIEEVLEDAAQRAGRSLDDTSRNPLYGRLRTVADLVHFLGFQPPESAA